MKQTFSVAVLLSSVGLLSCVTRQFNPQSDVQAKHFKNIPADEDAVRPDAAGRNKIINKAFAYTDYESDARGERSLLEGPKVHKYKNGKLDRKKKSEFAFNEFVSCDYLPPWRDDKPGGKTAKFYCNSYRDGDEPKKLKVKYDNERSGGINTGVYGEVLATRLFWALGFPADAVFPVQVRCNGCTNDPWRHISSYWEIVELEDKIQGMTPGSNSYLQTENDLAEKSVRYLAETLTAFEVYADVRAQKDNGVMKIEHQREFIFSPTDGILHLGENQVEVFDPAKKRLIKTDVAGYDDFAVDHMNIEGLANTKKVVRDFASALVEQKHNSIPIESYYHQGWAFGKGPHDPDHDADIFNVDASRKDLVLQRQEIALLAAFVAHADNKAEQQRVVCLDADKIEAEDKDCKSASADPRFKTCADGTDVKFTDCKTSTLMIQDLGFSFGFGSKKTGVDEKGRPIFDSSPASKSYGTADADGFMDAPIFKDEASCTTTVNEWATGTKIEIKVTEAAKKALVTKLKKLANNENDLVALFRSARLHLKALHLENKPFPALTKASSDDFLGGDLEREIVEKWVRNFRTKVDRLNAVSCPKN